MKKGYYVFGVVLSLTVYFTLLYFNSKKNEASGAKYVKLEISDENYDSYENLQYNSSIELYIDTGECAVLSDVIEDDIDIERYSIILDSIFFLGESNEKLAKGLFINKHRDSIIILLPNKDKDLILVKNNNK